MKKSEPLFSISSRHTYKDGFFEAGLVKNSPHRVNKVYLRVGEMFFHLRDDEAFAIINALTSALWSYKILQSQKGFNKVKWYKLAEITKDTKRKPKSLSPHLTPTGKYLVLKDI